MDIALVTADQHESLVDLLCELHAFYHDPPRASRDEVRAHLTDRLLAPGSPLRLVVADLPGNGVAGLAAVHLVSSVVDPTPAARQQCHLKELFVSRAQRGHGIGTALVRWVAAYAIAHGCGRVDWNVSATNRSGIGFYERLGATRVAERLSYRLSGDELARLARASTHEYR